MSLTLSESKCDIATMLHALECSISLYFCLFFFFFSERHYALLLAFVYKCNSWYYVD